MKATYVITLDGVCKKRDRPTNDQGNSRSRIVLFFTILQFRLRFLSVFSSARAARFSQTFRCFDMEMPRCSWKRENYFFTWRQIINISIRLFSQKGKTEPATSAVEKEIISYDYLDVNIFLDSNFRCCRHLISSHLNSDLKFRLKNSGCVRGALGITEKQNSRIAFHSHHWSCQLCKLGFGLTPLPPSLSTKLQCKVQFFLLGSFSRWFN